MKLSSIISLANTKVELRFRVMVRSLRSVGCDLPVQVIPYDGSRFELPQGCEWLEDQDFFQFLQDNQARPVLRKYLCLTQDMYQFVDSDVVFLRDPREVLSPLSGFVTSCGNWRNPAHTLTPQLQKELARHTSLWQWKLFNSGQFACDRSLFDRQQLVEMLKEPTGYSTILGNPYHEQPGMNLLVCRSGVSITNVTLPPMCMESTWAGDYPGDFASYWGDARKKPYLIHWAGQGHATHRPIDQLYLNYLTEIERRKWDAECVAHKAKRSRNLWYPRGMKARLGKAYRAARIGWADDD